MDRKLAAIVAADVVGYSRLTGQDETGTIMAVRKLQHDVIVPAIANHGGRLVKTMGDGFLMEFASVVAGIEAAVEIQRHLSDAPRDETIQGQIALRIGVHIGDVVTEGDDIFGDGVNIAARIEAMARPGGVGISDDAYRQVRDRLALAWADGGEHEVKNIARPVRIWHWSVEGGSADETDAKPQAADLPLPDKPSVAVLPFDNMSGDPEQEFFADGMTEDLITDLSKVSGLFVVARNSTFVFKGQSVNVPEIGRKLGVRHVVEGSVRKAGPRVRINVQLIDAATGGHVWADRYDGALDDVFELQDDVCSKVVSVLSVRLTHEEKELMSQVHTRNVDAYELFVRAKAMPYPPIPKRIKAAREMFAQVVEMEPTFAGGYAGLSWMVGFGAIWGHDDPVALGRKAEELADKAIAVDPNFGWTYTARAIALAAQHRTDEALTASRRSLELLPNDADAHAFHALLLSIGGRPEAGEEMIDQAIRLNPQFIKGPYLNVRSQIRFLRGDYEGAIASHEENIARGGPVGPPAYCWAAACYKAAGYADKARETVSELETRFPEFGLEGWNFLAIFPSSSGRDRVRALMIEGGVPA